ncbi:MAG TPA: septal ring lytic transglycosylase RlpA family protein [Nitrospirales bacterium]|nr:septal ring lytic transglycosylase RlpA family protein [Nitrospirales bacterium]
MNPAFGFRTLPAFLLLLLLLLIAWGMNSCAGRPQKNGSHPAGYPVGYVQRGYASWYGPGFHGRKTANGEVYNSHQLTAAHRTLPFGSVAQVRSLTNDHRVTVRINDRGPFVKGRIIDLSLAAAQALAMAGPGTDQVELQVIGYRGDAGALGYLRVQVASFVEQANAQALARKLKGKYSDVRIVAVELSSGRYYRVQVGQFTSEQQAEELAERLASQFDTEPLVIRDD